MPQLCFSLCCWLTVVLNVTPRAVVSPAKALIPAIRPLLSATLQQILHTVSRVFPHAEQGLKRRRDQGAPLHLILTYVQSCSQLFQMELQLVPVRYQDVTVAVCVYFQMRLRTI